MSMLFILCHINFVTKINHVINHVSKQVFVNADSRFDISALD